MKLIEDHPALGKKLQYEDGKRKTIGVVTGVRKGGIITNRKTGRINKDTIQLRIKPEDGSRAFWTATMVNVLGDEETQA